MIFFSFFDSLLCLTAVSTAKLGFETGSVVVFDLRQIFLNISIDIKHNIQQNN